MKSDLLRERIAIPIAMCLVRYILRHCRLRQSLCCSLYIATSQSATEAIHIATSQIAREIAIAMLRSLCCDYINIQLSQSIARSFSGGLRYIKIHINVFSDRQRIAIHQNILIYFDVSQSAVCPMSVRDINILYTRTDSGLRYIKIY